MSTVIVRRTERHDPPELPSGEILLQSPPEIPEAKQDSFQQTLMYLPMLAMTVGMVSMIAGPTASTSAARVALRPPMAMTGTRAARASVRVIHT